MVTWDRSPANTPDRDRGMFSKSDRQFLEAGPEKFEEEHSRPARFRREQAIRERVWNTLLDFELLLGYFEQEDYTDMFYRDNDGELTSPHDAPTYDGVVATLAFLYRATESAGFDEFVATGVRRGEQSKGFAVNAHAEVEKIDPEPLDAIEARLDEDGVTAVSLDELDQLQEAGRLTSEEYEEAKAAYIATLQEGGRGPQGVSEDVAEKFHRTVEEVERHPDTRELDEAADKD